MPSDTVGRLMLGLLCLALLAACGRENRVGTSGVDPHLAAEGKRLFAELDCSQCHTTTGEAGTGPTMKGLYGSRVTLADGRTVVADDAYLRRSILQPGVEVVRGYGRYVMLGGTATEQDRLAQDDTVRALVAYIESLK